MKPETTACFTGHRPDKLLAGTGGDRALLHEIRHELQNKILSAVNDGYVTFLCGMAQGVDIWAGEIVLSLQETFPQIELVAVLPHPGHGSGWPPEWKKRLQRLLRYSREILVASPAYHRGCFLQRDRVLVDHASRLIGVWIPGNPGGTSYTIGYARQKSLEIDLVLLAPEDGAETVSFS